MSATIASVELTEHAERVVEKLSGGQASRVLLACALVGFPGLLVLDEPTVGLDPLTRRAPWETFRGLASQGKTLFISSHVMDEASRRDSVLLLRAGRVLAHSPIAEIQRRPGAENPEDASVALIGESA